MWRPTPTPPPPPLCLILSTSCIASRDHESHHLSHTLSTAALQLRCLFATNRSAAKPLHSTARRQRDTNTDTDTYSFGEHRIASTLRSPPPLLRPPLLRLSFFYFAFFRHFPHFPFSSLLSSATARESALITFHHQCPPLESPCAVHPHHHQHHSISSSSVSRLPVEAPPAPAPITASDKRRQQETK